MALVIETTIHQQEIGEVFQLPGSRHARLQSAQRACRGIAWIREWRQLLLLPFRIQLFKGSAGHDGLPARLESGQIGFHLERHGPYGAGVLRDIFAHQPIPARDGLTHAAVPVMRRHRQSVQLQLRHIFESLAIQQIAHAAVEFAQLVFIQRVVETQHRRAMRNLDETFARLSAHALGGRIGCDQLGMLGLKLLQPPDHHVVFCVADFRLI